MPDKIFTVNVKVDYEQLKKAATGLSDKQINKAASRAINETLMVGRTQARTAVKQVYTVAQRYLPKNVDIKRAFPNKLWGSIVASATPLPADAFNLSFVYKSGTKTTVSKRGIQKTKLQVRKAKKGGGVTFEAIRGKKQTYQHAFLLPTMKGRVFARGEYKTGGNVWGWKQRLGPGSRKENANGNDAVKPLIAVSIHGAAVNPKVQNILENMLQPKFVERFEHHIGLMEKGILK